MTSALCASSYQNYEIAYVLQIPYLRSLKFNLENSLDSKHKADVRQAVPAINVLGRQMRGNFDRLVIKNVLEYFSKPRINLWFVHCASLP